MYRFDVQPVITPEESARLDATAAEPVAMLMERAGLGVALAAVRLGASYGSRVAVLAGPGNNGGDGYVAARYLRGRGVRVTVHALAPPREGSPAAAAAARAVAAGVRTLPLGPPVDADLVIDALFGVGFRGDLPEVVHPWLDRPVLAVDVPSGLDAATGTCAGSAFRAIATVTFHARKLGHVLGEGPDRCGPVEVVDIGLDGGVAELALCEADDAPVPARRRTAHKWSAGSVLVVGGAPGIVGAPVLAARSALEMGAGAVAVACPGGVASSVAAAGPGLMSRPVGKGDVFASEDATAVLAHSERFDVMVLGPGLGPAEPGFLSSVVSRRAGKLLLDADGITGLDGMGALTARRDPTVITPHAGEFRSLTGEPASYQAAARLPDRVGVVVLLKGNPTFVLGAERWVVTAGGPELATIGTGDVLAGMVAALWARGLDAETAARSGAYRHGIAGARLAEAGTVTAEKLSAAIGSYAW